MNNTINLARSFELLKLSEKLLRCTDSQFGKSIVMAINSGRIKEAVQMIKDQCASGNEVEVEMCIGRSTLDLIYILFS